MDVPAAARAPAARSGGAYVKRTVPHSGAFCPSSANAGRRSHSAGPDRPGRDRSHSPAAIILFKSSPIEWESSLVVADMSAWRNPIEPGTGRPSASLRFIDRFLRRAAPNTLVALVLGQLDAFNRISTTFGHDCSNSFCGEYADKLRALLPHGTPIIRLSERRFVLLLGLDSIASVMDVASHLTEDNQTQVAVGEDRFLVDLTLGIAVYPTHADDGPTLFRRAELALKEARERELAFDIYSPDSTQQHAALWKLESDLDRAINRGELEVYFQPKVALSGERVVGVEALTRWRSAAGFVPPQQFIPIAERSGSIVPLTWLVLDKTLESARRWPRPGAAFSVAVNVAPQLLTHREFFPRVESLAEALRGLGMNLTVELTEDSLVRGHEGAPLALQRLRKLGIGIAIDDFGKGYSSLTYLKEIPATEVKIDKGFVEALAANAKDRQIVQAVISLARAFEMTVVAEGVDSEEALKAVAELGCEIGQGFFLARPMRPDLLAAWLADLSPGGRRFPQLGVIRLE